MATKTVQVTTSTASWRAVASDGSLHTDLSAMATAGKVPFPGLDPGGMLASLTMRSITSAGADGSAFYFKLNNPGVPADTEADLCGGSGQRISLPGFAPPVSLLQIHNVWIRKLTAGDYIILRGDY